MTTDIDSLAVTVVFAMQGRTVATAESITGGQLGSTITSIPGASQIFRGGVIAYATDLKSSLLGDLKLCWLKVEPYRRKWH